MKDVKEFNYDSTEVIRAIESGEKVSYLGHQIDIDSDVDGCFLVCNALEDVQPLKLGADFGPKVTIVSVVEQSEFDSLLDSIEFFAGKATPWERIQIEVTHLSRIAMLGGIDNDRYKNQLNIIKLMYEHVANFYSAPQPKAE